MGQEHKFFFLISFIKKQFTNSVCKAIKKIYHLSKLIGFCWLVFQSNEKFLAFKSHVTVPFCWVILILIQGMCRQGRPAETLGWRELPAEALGWRQLPAEALGWRQLLAGPPGWRELPAESLGWRPLPAEPPGWRQLLAGPPGWRQLLAGPPGWRQMVPVPCCLLVPNPDNDDYCS